MDGRGERFKGGLERLRKRQAGDTSKDMTVKGEEGERGCLPLSCLVENLIYIGFSVLNGLKQTRGVD